MGYVRGHFRGGHWVNAHYRHTGTSRAPAAYAPVVDFPDFATMGSAYGFPHPPPQPGEVPLFHDDLVLVTNRRLQSGAAMCPLSFVSAAWGEASTAPPTYAPALALGAGALLSLAVMLSYPAAIPVFLLLLLATAVAAVRASGKVLYRVLVTASGATYVLARTWEPRRAEDLLRAVQTAATG